jgi:predicted enzyme related to lactoylglutathione lyase
MFRSALPGLTYRIDDLFSAGDKVVMRWTATATDTVGFMGRPPTGRRASATGINIYRVADGMHVDDIEQVVDELTAAGVEFTRYDEFDHDAKGITARAGGGRIAWFQDPDGNTFSIEADA